MKNIFILLFAVLLGGTACIAQNISFTIKPGSNANSAQVFMRSNADLTGVVSQILVTFAIPASVGPAAPATTFTLNAAFPQWGTLSLSTPTTENVNGVSSYIYTYFGVPLVSTTTSFTNGVEILLGEIGFPGGTDLSTLKLVNLPDGGSSTISYLLIELGGVPISNTTALTYGGDATNSPNGFSGLSYVTLGSVLPVKFLSFYAIKSGDNARLSWTVANDGDNKYFDLERSANTRNYVPFARVNALENGKNTNTYEASDAVLSKHGSKDLYYRIKQVDKNGSITYSLVRNLKIEQGLGMSLFPNPARSTSKLVVDAPSAGKAAIIVRDATGKQVQLMNLQFVKGMNQKDLNVSALPAGDYNVTVIAESLNQTIKFSKLN
jgi:hypothetical protein